MKPLPAHLAQEIGLHFVLERLKVQTSMARQKAARQEFYEDLSKLEKELKDIEYTAKKVLTNPILTRALNNLLSHLKNLQQTFEELKAEKILDTVALYEIKLFAYTVNQIVSLLRQNGVEYKAAMPLPLREAYQLLDPEQTNLPHFMVYSCYEKDLQAVREHKRVLEQRLEKEERNSANFKQLLEERREQVILEQQKEEEVRRTLSEKLRTYVGLFEFNLRVLTDLDLRLAKARLSLEYPSVRPVIDENAQGLHLQEMVNPMVLSKNRREGFPYTPVSVSLLPGSTVITGANMGGKSVALKTIALNTALALMGFFVFAKEAVIPWIDFIELSFDDSQSMDQGLSSFAVQIKSLSQAAQACEDHTGLIVIDELARGTNPWEGQAIVEATLHFLHKRSSFSVISTHYDLPRIGDIPHYQVKGLAQADFSDLEEGGAKGPSYRALRKQMDYSLERISKAQVPRDALRISRFLKLEPKLLESIERYYREESNGQ